MDAQFDEFKDMAKLKGKDEKEIVSWIEVNDKSNFQTCPVVCARVWGVICVIGRPATFVNINLSIIYLGNFPIFIYLVAWLEY